MARGPQGIRGIRQSIPSGFAIGRSSPGATKGQPGLVPLPPTAQQAIISGASGKATSAGGTMGAGTLGVASSSSVAAGAGITVAGGPVYTVSLTSPITIPLLFAEQTAPATPAVGTYILYMDSADHKLKCKNSAGTVTILGP